MLIKQAQMRTNLMVKYFKCFLIKYLWIRVLLYWLYHLHRHHHHLPPLSHKMGPERPLILPSCLWPGGFQLSMMKHLIVSGLIYFYWYLNMIELHLCNLYNYQPAVFPEHIPSWLGPLACFPRFSMPPCKEHMSGFNMHIDIYKK